MEESSSYTAYEGHPSVATETDDMALLRRYVDLGSETAFSELVRRHMPWIHATCRKALRDAHRAEDAAQAVFIILARRAATITPQTRLSGWLFNTARFVVRDARKAETRYRRRESVARDLAADRISFTPDRPALDADTQSALDDGLATLTERDRLALIMHFYEGLSLEEMSGLLGIGKEGVKKRVSRALARLRGRLGKRKGTLATLAVLALMMRSRAASAAPGGLGQAAVNAALIPGRGSDLARAIAEQAMSAAAGASSRLFRAALVGQFATILVAVAVSTMPTSPAARPVAGPSARSANAAPAAAQSRTFASANPAPHKQRPAHGNGLAYANDPEPPYHSGADDPEPRPDEPQAKRAASSSSTETHAGAGSSGGIARASATSDAGNSTFVGLPPVQRAPFAAPALPQTVDRSAGLPRADGVGGASASAAPHTPRTPVSLTDKSQPPRQPVMRPTDRPVSPTPVATTPGGTGTDHGNPQDPRPHPDGHPDHPIFVDRGDDGGRHVTRVFADGGDRPWHTGVRRNCPDDSADSTDPAERRRRHWAWLEDHGDEPLALLDHAPTPDELGRVIVPNHAVANLPQSEGPDFAGVITPAALTADANLPPLASGLDAPTFQAVPEPGVMSLALVAAAALLRRRPRDRTCPPPTGACP